MEELYSKKSPEVEALIKKIDEYRLVDNTKHLDAACDLFDLAQECGNEDLRDYASCALGDACCMNNDFSQALYYLSAGVQGLAKTDEYQLACRTYNELGVIWRSEGHFITSEESFINAIEIARAHRLYQNEAVACTNFASLCNEMEAPKRAIEYHYRCLECCNFVDDSAQKYELMSAAYASIMKIYVCLGQEEDADKAYESLNKILSAHPEYEEIYDVCNGKLVYFRFKKDEKSAKDMKEKCLDLFYQCEEYIIFFDETKDIIAILQEDGDYEELTKIFNRIEEISQDEELINLRLYIETNKIKMYQTLGDTDRLNESLKRYFEYSEKKVVDNKKSFLATLRLRSELAQQRTKNLFLSAAAETDTLTGIANRFKLNTVVDELFIMANNEGKNLGVEMMDIDFFKQVNDTYGHSKGDELLVALGGVLKSLVNEKIFVARYGGDEFIIYYYDMTDEEIIEAARYIKNSMELIGEKMNLGKVTVSQGIVNHIPRPMNRAWDYMNAADLALYFVKNHGKANGRLIHRATELETLEWDKLF